MMQAILATATVLGALSYLGWKAYKAFFRKKESCEGCAFSKASGPQQHKS